MTINAVQEQNESFTFISIDQWDKSVFYLFYPFNPGLMYLAHNLCHMSRSDHHRARLYIDLLMAQLSCYIMNVPSVCPCGGGETLEMSRCHFTY